MLHRAAGRLTRFRKAGLRGVRAVFVEIRGRFLAGEPFAECDEPDESSSDPVGLAGRSGADSALTVGRPAVQ